ALQLLRAPGVGFERRLLPNVWARHRMKTYAQPAFGWPCILNAAELSVCLGWPIGNPVLHGVNYVGRRQLPAHEGTTVSAASAKTRITGQVTYPGQESLLNLPAPAGLRHLHILGPTGVGK